MGSNGKSGEVVAIGEMPSYLTWISKKMLRRSGVDDSPRATELLD